MIPTRLHALADYLLPAAIAALSFSPRRGRMTRRIMQAGPVWHYGYTVLTRYEGGLVPSITMRTHLACDAIGALTFVGHCGPAAGRARARLSAARGSRSWRARRDRHERPRRTR